MDLIFTELYATTTCLICKQKVVYRDFNMKLHHTAKQAKEYNKYSGGDRNIASDQLHAYFNRPTVISAGLKEKVKPNLTSPGS